MWDINSQVAAWLKSNAATNPLRGHIDKAYGFGYSQTGGFLNTYVNAIHPLANDANGKPIYDGYFITVAGGSFVGIVPINACRQAPPLSDPRRDHRQRRRAGHPHDVAVRLHLRHRRPAGGQRRAAGPLPPLRDGGRGPRVAVRALLLGQARGHRQGGAAGAAVRVQRGRAQPLPDRRAVRRDAAEPRRLGRGTAHRRRPAG